MNYRLLLQPEAELDLEDVYYWYEQRTRGLGSEFIRAVDASISAIHRNFLAYAVVYRQVRRKLIRKFPYGIFYVIRGDTIIVIACFHVRRDPQQWQRRT